MPSRKADAELKFSAQTQPLAPKYSLQFSLLRGHGQQLPPTLHKPFSSSSASSGIFHLPSKTLNFAFYSRAALHFHWGFVCLDEELGFYSNPLWSLGVSNACLTADHSSGSIASPAVTLSPLLEPFQLSSWPWRRFWGFIISECLPWPQISAGFARYNPFQIFLINCSGLCLRTSVFLLSWDQASAEFFLFKVSAWNSNFFFF